ncbi:hypothetical protein L1278_003865 [Pontibacter sp. HSC-36F09]|nr:hypothetical protein [Pontibacter sp. HSC-36F09]
MRVPMHLDDGTLQFMAKNVSYHPITKVYNDSIP